MNKTFKVTMQERQKDGSIRTLTQIAMCPSKEEVVKWYGLTEPDIISFSIEEVASLA